MLSELFLINEMMDPDSIFNGEDPHGIDRANIMLHFMPVFDARPGKSKGCYNRFKSFLVQQLQRGITLQEDINLAQGIVNYLQSEPATTARTTAMNYLFNLKFLADPVTKIITKP